MHKAMCELGWGLDKDAPRKALSRVGLIFFVHTTMLCSHVHSTRSKTGRKDRIQVV